MVAISLKKTRFPSVMKLAILLILDAPLSCTGPKDSRFILTTCTVIEKHHRKDDLDTRLSKNQWNKTNVAHTQNKKQCSMEDTLEA